MNKVEYLVPQGLHRSPVYSAVAVIPSGSSLVCVGGQNAFDAQGRLVGVGDLAAQARQVKANLEAALAAAGCTWRDVVRVQVHLKAGQDPRAAFAPFAPAMAERKSPPLVGVFQVAGLAHPDFLLEVALEAVKP